MKGIGLDRLLLPSLHPVYDQYRIKLFRSLLIICFPVLLAESTTALLSGYTVIGAIELITLVPLGLFFRWLWSHPHHIGNTFIIFSIFISILSVTLYLESFALLMFLVAQPVFYIFFLGIRKGSAVTLFIVLLLLTALAHYYYQRSTLPWPTEAFVFSFLVFSFIFIMTVAYEKTNALLLENLRNKAEFDDLTGISSRRAFLDILEYEIERTRRYRLPLSLILLDVDHFKKINDTHGHQTGDKVLRNIAQLCVSTLRKSDVVGRVGGEEFACLLPETGPKAAGLVAEKIRLAVVESCPPDFPSCTISLGVAGFTSHDTQQSLFQRADKAMYAAKSQGRNRVETG